MREFYRCSSALVISLCVQCQRLFDEEEIGLGNFISQICIVHCDLVFISHAQGLYYLLPQYIHLPDHSHLAFEPCGRYFVLSLVLWLSIVVHE